MNILNWLSSSTLFLLLAFIYPFLANPLFFNNIAVVDCSSIKLDSSISNIVNRSSSLTTTTTSTTTRLPVTKLRIEKSLNVNNNTITGKQSPIIRTSSTTRLPYNVLKEIATQLGYVKLGDSYNNKSSITITTTTKSPTTSGPSLSTTTATNLKNNTIQQSINQQQQLNEPEHNKYKLPSWFNYELYKKFNGKPRYLSRPIDNEIHKRIYLRTALKVFEQRALYRAGRTNTLSSINELSDLTSEELLALKTRNNPKEKFKWNKKLNNNINSTTIELPDCCTYEQLYTRIIELLNKTSGVSRSDDETTDLTLSRALLEELEQKPLMLNEEKSSSEEMRLAEYGGIESMKQSQPAVSTNTVELPMELKLNNHTSSIIEMVGTKLIPNATTSKFGLNLAINNEEKVSNKKESQYYNKTALLQLKEQQIMLENKMGLDNRNTSNQEQHKHKHQQNDTSLIEHFNHFDNNHTYSPTTIIRKTTLHPKKIISSLKYNGEKQSNISSDGIISTVNGDLIREAHLLKENSNDNKAKQTNSSPSNTTMRTKENGKGSLSNGDDDSVGDENISRAIEESIKSQIVEQLGGDSELGNQLRRQFSALFGQPVKIRATVSNHTDSYPSTSPSPANPLTSRTIL